MKRLLLIILFIASVGCISCSKNEIPATDVYCLVCTDAAGNDTGVKEHNTLQWAKDHSGPGKPCNSYSYKSDHTCP